MGDMGNGNDKYIWHEGDVEPFDTVEEALTAESPYEPGEPAATAPEPLNLDEGDINADWIKRVTSDRDATGPVSP